MRHLFLWSGGPTRVEAEPGSSLPPRGMVDPLLKRRKTSRADIPSPGTEPRAPFPSGALPSPVCGFVQRSCTGPRVPPVLTHGLALGKLEALENAHVDGIFLANSSQHPDQGRTASCSVPACSSHGSVGHKLVRALLKPQLWALGHRRQAPIRLISWL